MLRELSNVWRQNLPRAWGRLEHLPGSRRIRVSLT